METINYPNYVFSKIGELFPDAKCELNYSNVFELTLATILSAQATDKSVNVVTKELFSKYPTPYLLSLAKEDEVISIIKSVGLSKTKAKNIIKLSQELTLKYNGKVPNTFDELIALPGIGTKTANVILAEGFNLPGLAVDTHVLRVSNRLGLINTTDTVVAEKKLKTMYDPKDWGLVHLRLLFFGRYLCKAQNPLCDKCPFQDYCKR